jgi:hypothetical protein
VRNQEMQDRIPGFITNTIINNMQQWDIINSNDKVNNYIRLMTLSDKVSSTYTK